MTPTEEIVYYITTWYPHIGAGDTRARIDGLSSPYAVMMKAADEMLKAESCEAFPAGHKEHIAYALQMVASGGFLSSSAAVGSVYLATRFEFYFRVLSGRLNPDGEWKTDKDLHDIKNLLGGKRLDNKKKKEDRINSVALAYKIMKTNDTLPLAQICTSLDNSLYSKRTTKMPNGKELEDMGDRIEYLRHRSAHGHWGDITGDADFYGLLTALVFYNQGDPDQVF